jgi:hypothetical protein
MSMKWIAIGLSVCAVVQVALMMWGSCIRSDVLRGVRIALTVALIGLASALALGSYEKHSATSSIQTRLDSLKVRQADLRARFDELAESAKASNDPVLLQSLGIRRAALVKEEEANKKELDQLQYEIDEMKE